MSLALHRLDMSVRYTLFALANLLLLLWTYKVVARAKAGWSRFIWSTPLFVLCYLVFALFDYSNPSERSMSLHVVLNYLWLCPWKLIAFSMNRGSLIKALESGSLSAFTVSLLLNVNVAFEAKPLAAKKKDDDVGTKAKEMVYAHDDVRFSVFTYKGKDLLYEALFVLCRMFGKMLICLMAGYVYATSEKPSIPNTLACAWYTYGWLGCIQDVSLLISLLVVNIKLQDSFDQPYLSESFSDFWARRWNRVMSTQLRDLCYEPIVQRQWIAPREYFAKREKPFIRRMIGIALTFIASALIHWIVFDAMSSSSQIPFLFMGLFFLNALLVGFEVLLVTLIHKSESFAKLAKSIPKMLRILLVHIGLLAMAHFLFLPEMRENGITRQSFEPATNLLKKLSVL